MSSGFRKDAKLVLKLLHAKCLLPHSAERGDRIFGQRERWGRKESGTKKIITSKVERRKETLREAWAHFFLEPRLNSSVWVPGPFDHVSEAKSTNFHLNSLTLLGVIVYHRYVAVRDCAWLCVAVRGCAWLHVAVHGCAWLSVLCGLGSV